MTLDAAEKLVTQYEKLLLDVTARVKARAATKVVMSTDKIEKLDKALGSPEATTAFLASMPASPGAEKILDAFGSNPEKLGILVNTVLGGNMKVLAVLAAKGCKGDPAKLLALCDQFSGNPKPLLDLLSEGGLADNPDTLAAILQDGCDSDPTKLSDVCTTFADKGDRDKLSATLSAGGLGLAPGAAGALAGPKGEGLRKLTRALTTPDELTKLNGLLAKGGLDGSASGRPGLLGDVIEKGLGGDPARLLELHDAFGTPGPDDGMSTFSTMLDGMDSTDGRGGERMARAMERFKTVHGDDDAGAAKKLRDPFMKNLNAMGRAASAQDLSAGTTDKMATAAGARPALDPARQRGLLEAGLQPDAAAKVLEMALADPAERALAVGLGDGTALTLARVASLETAGLPLGPDPEQSDKTKVATTEVTKATAALLALANGGKLADAKALEALCDALLAEAAVEPDGGLKAAALLAAKAGAAAIATTLARRAAGAATGPAGEALVKLGEIEKLRAGASDAEKAALKATSAAALTAAGAGSAASEDPKLAAGKAAQAVTDGFPDNERLAETTKRNNAAKTAATAALAAVTQVAAAPAPADPALLARCAALAEASATAGRAAPGETFAKEAFDAAKALSDAIAKACKVAAGFSETAEAMGSVKGAKALNMASSCDNTLQILKKSSTGAAGVQALGTASDAVRSGALSIAELDRLKLDGTLKGAALEAATREAGLGKDVAPSASEIDLAGKAADKRATDAKVEANLKWNALKLADPAIPGPFETLLTQTQTAAQAALRFGPLAVDDTARTETLKAAEDAFTEITASAERLAKAQLALANTQLATDRNTALTNVAVDRDALPINLASIGAAFDSGKAAIGANASALLADILLTDATVQAARDTANAEAVKASLPGADRFVVITAMKAAREADEQVQIAAKAKFLALVNLIPAFPGPGNETSLLINPDRVTKAGNAPGLIRDALAGADALAGSLAKWRESADALHKTLQRGIKDLTPLALPATKEKADLDQLKIELGLSDTKLTAIRAEQGLHDPTTVPFKHVIDRSRQWTTWTNKTAPLLPPDPALTTANKAMQNTHGFTLAAGTEGARGTDNGALPGFSGMSRDALVRLASGFDSDPYVGPALEDKTMADGSLTSVDMKHICGRHVSESYDYGEPVDSGPEPDDHKAGQLILGKTVGAEPADTTPEGALIFIARKYNKVNSLLSDTVTKANLADIALQAMEAVQVAHGAVTLESVVQATVALPARPKGWVSESVNVLGPPPMRITVGLEFEDPVGSPGKVSTRMMYAADGDTVTMADMLTMARAVGY